jgi:hypothetical protein
MVKKVRLMAIGLFGLSIIAGALLLYSTVVQAGECHVIAIHSKGEMKTPPPLSIKGGDCVVFTNLIGEGIGTQGTDEVKVAYKEGAKCQKGVRISFDFQVDKNMCYTSGWMRYGESSTMVFATPGTYDYEIRYLSGGAPITARVTVK